jgi:hypothetical protein
MLPTGTRLAGHLPPPAANHHARYTGGSKSGVQRRSGRLARKLPVRQMLRLELLGSAERDFSPFQALASATCAWEPASRLLAPSQSSLWCRQAKDPGDAGAFCVYLKAGQARQQRLEPGASATSQNHRPLGGHCPSEARHLAAESGSACRRTG